MPINITEEFVRNLIEQNVALIKKTLTMDYPSINQSLSFILNKIIQIDHAPQLAVTY